eukprot:1159970-Pelagomonas_calceolata.AAC.8
MPGAPLHLFSKSVDKPAAPTHTHTRPHLAYICEQHTQGQVNGFAPAPKPKPTSTAGVLQAHQNSVSSVSPASAPLAKRLKDVLDTLLQKVGENLTPEEVLQLVSEFDGGLQRCLQGLQSKCMAASQLVDRPSQVVP